MQKPLIDYSMPLVTESGHASASFQRVLNRITNDLALYGSGSPEGVVEAFQYSRYFDYDASAGSNMYFKKYASVGGDATQGWVLV